MGIKARIIQELNVPESLIDEALDKAYTQVKRFMIPKRNGQKRIIFQPSAKLKIVQYWLMHKIFSDLPIHPTAMAYRTKISILDNAEIHKRNRFYLKLDLKDFFPSIKVDDLIPIVQRWFVSQNENWEFDDEAISLIKKSCFDKTGSLPIGYPSSPIISNIVMYSFDVAVVEKIELLGNVGEIKYSRYADDLIFSTNEPGVCMEILKMMRILVPQTDSPRISLNESKIKLCSSSGGSAVVTGLRIADDQHITIHRKQKDHIRLLLSLYKKKKLNPKEYPSLLGHLAYIQYVDKLFYTKIQGSFFLEIKELQGSQSMTNL